MTLSLAKLEVLTQVARAHGRPGLVVRQSSRQDGFTLFREDRPEVGERTISTLAEAGLGEAIASLYAEEDAAARAVEEWTRLDPHVVRL